MIIKVKRIKSIHPNFDQESSKKMTIVFEFESVTFLFGSIHKHLSTSFVMLVSPFWVRFCDLIHFSFKRTLLDRDASEWRRQFHG